MFVSALTGYGIDTLRAEIAALLASLWVDIDVAMPYAAGELLANALAHEAKNYARGNFTGISYETIFYDPDVFVAPVRATMLVRRVATPADPDRRFSFVECLSNIFNTNGRPGQLTAADPCGPGHSCGPLRPGS